MIQKDIQDFKSPKIFPTLSTPWGTLSFRGLAKVPHGWKCGLSTAFRVLEWAYPLYTGAGRVGIFECILGSEQTRSERVFIWKQGHTNLIIVGRPKHLPPEALPANGKIKGQHNSRQEFYFLRKHNVQDFARVTYHRYNEHIIQSYHYGKDQASKPKGISFQNPFQNANNNNGQLDRSSVPLDTVSHEKNTEDWWSNKETFEDISPIHIPIISHRHLSTEHIVIGKGAFGTVALKTLAGGREVVTKSFDKETSSENILTEAKLLALLSDTGFVPAMFGVSYSSDFRISIVQEYCASGVTLYDVVTEGRYDLSNHTWLTIIQQMARGLKDIHLKGVLLNDLKEDNVLVDCCSAEVRVVYIDLGLATFKKGREYSIPEQGRYLCGHLAPEVLAGQPTRPSSDVYSLGRILENISFECDLCGLCNVADGCLEPEPQRLSTNCLIDWVDRLDPHL